MLRPLLLLVALTAVPGDSAQVLTDSKMLNISTCPITYFGQKYSQVYVNFTSTNFVVCFNGFYPAANTGDCVLGPKVNWAYFTVAQSFAWLQTKIQSNIPAITTPMNCYLEFYLNTPISYSLLSFASFQQQSAVELFYTGIGSQRAEVALRGNQTVQMVVTNTPSAAQTSTYTDVSGCRDSGVPYMPDTTVSIDAATCRSLRCSQTAVLVNTTCGPSAMCDGMGQCAITTTATTTTTPPPTSTTTSTTSATSSTTSATSSTSTTPTTTSTSTGRIGGMPPPTSTTTVTTISTSTSTATRSTTISVSQNITGQRSACTVTGPSVIDFYNKVTSVKDRCVYSLLKVPDFQVLAFFMERRLTGVSFLDSVLLKVDGADMVLKQGGRVLLNNSTLNLDSSPQLVHGVEISKDNTGVTARVNINNLNMMIFFDGTTVQILMKGSTGSPPTGLCEDSSSEARVSEYSSVSCEMLHTNTDDSFRNCTNKTDSCNLLNKAPFTSCGIDPKPYITACTDTLSRYPAVDGLKCQFLEAYARACSLKSNTTLKGWRAKAECRSPGAFCQNRTCSNHEFCGEVSHYGDTRCFCRADFASSYRERNAFGNPTVCSDNTASITLVSCLLDERGIDSSVLHLIDPTCRGQVDELNHLVTFSFNSTNCGTQIMANESQITYKNTIMTQNVSSDMIIRYDDFMLDFSCYHARHSIQTVSFTIMESEVSGIMTAGPWIYTVSMRAYVDDACTKPVERYTNLRLNERVWVKLETNGLDENVVAVVTDSCWATDEPSSISSKKYYLIEKGYPAESTVEVKGNGEGTSNYFAFNMFRFSGHSREIYLHCSLHLCVKQEGNCAMNKRRRRRRSASSNYESDSSISMGWTH